MLIIPTFIQLCGPTPKDTEATTFQTGNTWEFPGSAASSSCKPFHAQKNLPDVDYATFQIVWNPKAHAEVRLIKFIAGPETYEQVAYIEHGGYNSPVPRGVDITQQMKQWIDAKTYFQLGLQIRTWGYPCNVFASHIEINWRLPEYQLVNN